MKHKVFLAGMLASLLALGMMLVSCGGDDDDNGGGTTSHLVGGKAVRGSFYADKSSAKSVVRAAALTEAEIWSGKVELDGGEIVLNLTGIYDPETSEFVLTAGKTMVIVEIKGKLLKDGTASGIKAKVKTQSNGTYSESNFDFTPDKDAEATGTPATDQVTGFPSDLIGKWKYPSEFPVMLEFEGEEEPQMVLVQDYIFFAITPLSMGEIVNEDGIRTLAAETAAEGEKVTEKEIEKIIGQIKEQAFSYDICDVSGSGSTYYAIIKVPDPDNREHFWYTRLKITKATDGWDVMMVDDPPGGVMPATIDEAKKLENFDPEAFHLRK